MQCEKCGKEYETSGYCQCEPVTIYTPLEIKPIVNYGWVCPLCDKVWSPYVQGCICHEQKLPYVTTVTSGKTSATVVLGDDEPLKTIGVSLYKD